MTSILLALWLLLQAPREYHRVPLEAVAVTAWRHVETCGPVVYVRFQRNDGDWHITLDNGKAKLVVEIIPSIPLAVPAKGMTIRVRGIAGYDRRHRWAEIHPVEEWTQVMSCG